MIVPFYFIKLVPQILFQVFKFKIPVANCVIRIYLKDYFISQFPTAFPEITIGFFFEKIHQSRSQSWIAIGVRGLDMIPAGKNCSNFIPAVEAVKKDDKREQRGIDAGIDSDFCILEQLIHLPTSATLGEDLN
jgi:hypothetical protein